MLISLFLFSYPCSTQSPAGALICCPPVSRGRGQKKLRHRPAKASGASNLKTRRLLHYLLNPVGILVGLSHCQGKTSIIWSILWDGITRSGLNAKFYPEKWREKNGQNPTKTTVPDALQSPLRESTGESRGQIPTRTLPVAGSTRAWNDETADETSHKFSLQRLIEGGCHGRAECPPPTPPPTGVCLVEAIAHR